MKVILDKFVEGGGSNLLNTASKFRRRLSLKIRQWNNYQQAQPEHAAANRTKNQYHPFSEGDTVKSNVYN